MLVLCLMPSVIYYAQNYVGTIGWSLTHVNTILSNYLEMMDKLTLFIAS